MTSRPDAGCAVADRDLVATETAQIRETYAAMRARVPQRHIESARQEFDGWLAREVAQAKAEALQAQAREFRNVAAKAWGGPERWITTGDNVGDLVAGWCEETALDYLEGDR